MKEYDMDEINTMNDMDAVEKNLSVEPVIGYEQQISGLGTQILGLTSLLNELKQGGDIVKNRLLVTRSLYAWSHE